MALEKHFGKRGCSSEVAVNLERGMSVEHIRERTLSEKGVQVVKAGVSFTETGVEQRYPSSRPAGVTSAAGKTSLQRYLSRVHKLGCVSCYLAAGMESVEVGDVSVTGFGFVKVLAPLHYLTVLADLNRAEKCGFFAEKCGKVFVNTKYIGGFGGIIEQLADDFVVHCRTCADGVSSSVGCKE